MAMVGETKRNKRQSLRHHLKVEFIALVEGLDLGVGELKITDRSLAGLGGSMIRSFLGMVVAKCLTYI